jgi:hypothetical protein
MRGPACRWSFRPGWCTVLLRTMARGSGWSSRTICTPHPGARWRVGPGPPCEKKEDGEVLGARVVRVTLMAILSGNLA